MQQIMDCRNLRTGWHYGRGVGAPKPVGDCAEHLVYLAMVAGLSQFNAFPNIDGGISLSIVLGQEDHTFRVNPDLSIDYWREDDPESDDERLTIEEARARLEILGRKQS